PVVAVWAHRERPGSGISSMDSERKTILRTTRRTRLWASLNELFATMFRSSHDGYRPEMNYQPTTPARPVRNPANACAMSSQGCWSRLPCSHESWFLLSCLMYLCRLEPPLGIFDNLTSFRWSLSTLNAGALEAPLAEQADYARPRHNPPFPLINEK